MPILMTGTFSKRAVSAWFLKTWRTRHIMLEKDCISWSAHVNGEVKGSLPISAGTTVAGRGLNLSIKHGERVLELACSSEYQLAQWRDAIKLAIDNAVTVSSEDAVCSICLDECTSDALQTACCSNHFHRKCLSEWLQTSQDRTCPLCRSDASSALNSCCSAVAVAGVAHRAAPIPQLSEPRLSERTKERAHRFVFAATMQLIGYPLCMPIFFFTTMTTSPGFMLGFIVVISLAVAFREPSSDDDR